ncbi:MAG: hypothetical protein ACYCS7_11305 [Acidimicrobiales bacterium]
MVTSNQAGTSNSMASAALSDPGPPGALAPPGGQNAVPCGAKISLLDPVGHVVGGIVGGVVGFGADQVLGAISKWVGTGAAWLLGEVGKALDATTNLDIGAGWFKSHFRVMIDLAAVLMVPLLFLAVIQGIIRQDLGGLARSVAVHIPLAVLLMGVAMALVQLALSATDTLSGAVASSMGSDSTRFLTILATALTTLGGATGGAAVPLFVTFMGALVVAFAAFVIWVELVVRSACIYVAVLFLPLALAGLVWPATAHWAKRVVEVLAALILAKFFVVAVMSLAVGAISGGGGTVGFSEIVSGIALLLLSAFTPFVLLRIIPMAEAGVIAHLDEHPSRARSLPRSGARMLRGAMGSGETDVVAPTAEELVSSVGIPVAPITPEPPLSKEELAAQYSRIAPDGVTWREWSGGGGSQTQGSEGPGPGGPATGGPALDGQGTQGGSGLDGQ